MIIPDITGFSQVLTGSTDYQQVGKVIISLLLEPAIPDLSQRIMAAIPLSLADRVLAWLFPGGGASLLRPVLASSLPLMLGAVLGLSLPLPGDEQSTWELQERSLVAPLDSEIWYE